MRSFCSQFEINYFSGPETEMAIHIKRKNNTSVLLLQPKSRTSSSGWLAAAEVHYTQENLDDFFLYRCFIFKYPPNVMQLCPIGDATL